MLAATRPTCSEGSKLVAARPREAGGTWEGTRGRSRPWSRIHTGLILASLESPQVPQEAPFCCGQFPHCRDHLQTRESC